MKQQLQKRPHETTIQKKNLDTTAQIMTPKTPTQNV